MVGDHIRTRRDGRWNHAIDCGDETVIHLDGDSDEARVRRSYRPQFVAGAEVVEVVTHRERTFPATEIVARAYSRIADPALAGMFRDSEAFACWCVTGRLGGGPANVVPAPAPDAEAPAADAVPPGPDGAKRHTRPASPRRAKRPAARARRKEKKARVAAKRGATSKGAARRSRPPGRSRRGARGRTRRR